MTYKHDHGKHDYDKDAFYFKGDQEVDQANDANVDQSASVEQVAAIDQELNQAVVQDNEQNNAVVVESGDGGDGGAGGGGDGADLDLDVIEAVLGSGLPPASSAKSSTISSSSATMTEPVEPAATVETSGTLRQSTRTTRPASTPARMSRTSIRTWTPTSIRTRTLPSGSLTLPASTFSERFQADAGCA